MCLDIASFLWTCMKLNKAHFRPDLCSVILHENNKTNTFSTPAWILWSYDFLFSFPLNYHAKTLQLWSNYSEVSQATIPNPRPDLRPCNQSPPFCSDQLFISKHAMKERYENRGLGNSKRKDIKRKGAPKTKNRGAKKREKIKMEIHRETEAGVVKRRER